MMPPFTRMVCPLIHSRSRLTRNNTAAAMSSERPRRLRGVISARSSSTSYGLSLSNSVSTDDFSMRGPASVFDDGIKSIRRKVAAPMPREDPVMMAVCLGVTMW